MDMAAFFHMNGYGAFVWPAFGVTAVLLVGLFVRSRLALKIDQKTLDLLQQARRGRRRDLSGAQKESDT